MNLIFDLGANEGGNLKYYLSKAEKVIAIEANPALISDIESKFKEEYENERLFIVNSCLTLKKNTKKVDFYVHNFETGLGRFAKPKINKFDYTKIKVPS